MKKLIILSVLLLSVLGLKSQTQCNLPYKSLSEFNKDTTAFMIYNFMERAECYKGKTIKEVAMDLQIPIKDYVRDASIKFFSGINIYIYDDITVSKRRDNKEDYNAIEILWENKVSCDNPEYKSFGRNYPDWNKGAYDYVKDMRIKEISVVIPDYSKYYEKYKPKETKSKNRTKATFLF